MTGLSHSSEDRALHFRVILILSLLASYPSPTLACSCRGSNLESYYDSSPNVFTAVITSSEYVGEGIVAAGFETTELFKGDIPFTQFRTYAWGSICGIPLPVGHEFLFFSGDSGRVGLCSGIRPVQRGNPPVTDPWIDLLRAYKNGDTMDLSSPWVGRYYDDVCALRTDFLSSEHRIPSSLNLTYRHSTYKSVRVANSNRPRDERNVQGFAVLELIFGYGREPDGSFVTLETQNRDFVAKFTSSNGQSLYRDAFQLFGDDALAFAADLATTPSVILKGNLENIGSIDGDEIRTTNAGDAIEDFLDCVRR